jgi:Iron-containing redox enzyme
VHAAFPLSSLGTLDRRIEVALEQGGNRLEMMRGAEPLGAKDAAMSLLRIHDLHGAPISRLDGPERWQHHPVVSELKIRLEAAYLAMLEGIDGTRDCDLPDNAADAIRVIAATDRVPRLYQWLASEATAAQVLEFIGLEGGPDGGFDDLVAICQVGLVGEAKLELARNYWDEMGRGDPSAVHTQLHGQMSQALQIVGVPRRAQPLEALHRSILGSLLATNRWLQPEMLGALGIIELQAGPRCRKVVAALERTGAPERALPFYQEHATVDPHHGKSWLSKVIVPLATGNPEMGHRMVRGARWRSAVNGQFLAAVSRRFGLLSAAPARVEHWWESPDSGQADTVAEKEYAAVSA